MADSTQVRELFRRFQHPHLQDMVKALEVRSDLDGIKYSEAANHLTAADSKIPEYQLFQKVDGIRPAEPTVAVAAHKRWLQQRQHLQFTGEDTHWLLLKLEGPKQRRSQG